MNTRTLTHSGIMVEKSLNCPFSGRNLRQTVAYVKRVALNEKVFLNNVTNEMEESVVNHYNLFRKMLYPNIETTCFGL